MTINCEAPFVTYWQIYLKIYQFGLDPSICVPSSDLSSRPSIYRTSDCQLDLDRGTRDFSPLIIDCDPILLLLLMEYRCRSTNPCISMYPCIRVSRHIFVTFDQQWQLQLYVVGLELVYSFFRACFTVYMFLGEIIWRRAIKYFTKAAFHLIQFPCSICSAVCCF